MTKSSSKQDFSIIELCRVLKNINALEFGIFKLHEKVATPYYVNLRLITSFPDAFHIVSDSFVKLIEQTIGLKGFDRIAGVPSAGLPFASVVAYELKKPTLFVRKQVAPKGRQRRVEGILIAGNRVILVDDLVATGQSIQKAATAIRAEGGVVSDAFVLLDRQQGAKEKLEKQNIHLHSILRISEVAKILYDMDAITEEDLKTVLKQIKE